VQRPSSVVVALAFFWTVYAIVAVFVLYQELLPASRHLLMILVGAGAVLAGLTLALLWRDRYRSSSGDRQ